MAKRTYVPQANSLSDRLHEYLTRYEEKLVVGKTGDQLAALAELIACLAAFVQKWPKPPPNN